VDLSLNIKEAFKSKGRQIYLKDSVASEMPRGTSTEVDVYFFEFKYGRVKPVHLYYFYERLGLVPVDPFTLASINEADLASAGVYRYATQWTNAENEHCYASFSRVRGVRSVRVGQQGTQYWANKYRNWWFAGVRKST
jgi:hypothetical protein